MAARSQGVVRMRTRKSELESMGSGKLGEKKKKRPEPGKLKKKKNLHIYTHIRIERYIQVGTMGRRPGV